MTQTNQASGGLNNYYLVRVDFPQRANQPAYTAECEDVIEALSLTPNEANIFKAIWRSANARKGNGKPDHKSLYDAEKMVHYAQRIVIKLKREGHREPKVTSGYMQVLDELPKSDQELIKRLEEAAQNKGGLDNHLYRDKPKREQE